MEDEKSNEMNSPYSGSTEPSDNTVDDSSRTDNDSQGGGNNDECNLQNKTEVTKGDEWIFGNNYLCKTPRSSMQRDSCQAENVSRSGFTLAPSVLAVSGAIKNCSSSTSLPDPLPEDENMPLESVRTHSSISMSDTFCTKVADCSEDSSHIGNEIKTSDSSVTAPVKFVPLGAVTPSNEESNCRVVPPVVSPPKFVFGQNLHERFGAVRGQHVPEMNGNSSEMLFMSSLQKEKISDNSADEHGRKQFKSLSDAAREYEEARAVKRKYDEVAVVTGEEDEVNVVQVNCKLYAYDNAAGTWMERGRGVLRLNDKDSHHSRVVMRSSGSLRVILNTKIWPGMVAERPSEKSIRLTAVDNSGQVKVFLLTGAQKEINGLFTALQTRLSKFRSAGSVNYLTQYVASSSGAKRRAVDKPKNEEEDPIDPAELD